MMCALWILALSIISAKFVDSPLTVSQMNFLNFWELNVPFVATTPSTPRRLNPTIKLILKFDLFVKRYSLAPHFAQPYSVYDSELNLNSSMYTDLNPFLSSASWRIIDSAICLTPGWVFTILFRSPHFLNLSFRLFFIFLFSVLSLMSISFFNLLISFHFKSLTVNFVPIKLFASSCKASMWSLLSFCRLLRYLLLSRLTNLIFLLNSLISFLTYHELTLKSFQTLEIENLWNRTLQIMVLSLSRFSEFLIWLAGMIVSKGILGLSSKCIYSHIDSIAFVIVICFISSSRISSRYDEFCEVESAIPSISRLRSYFQLISSSTVSSWLSS